MSKIGSLVGSFFDRHPRLKAFVQKFLKDNVGMLASVVSWTLLTSMLPIIAGLVAISSLFVRSPGAQSAVIDHLYAALQGAFTRAEIDGIVKASVQHRGLLAVIGVLGTLWGGSNVGGAISTVFQPIFQVRGRDYFKEKLLDVAMIFVLTALMVVIVAATTAGSIIDRLISPDVPGLVTFVIGTAIALLAAFCLFAVLYIAFPNVQPRFKIRHVWTGAALAAVLFEALTFIFPLYATHAHFQRYGALLFPIVLLTAWVYFFSMVLIIGAEVVAFGTLEDAARHGERPGPSPDGTVPQRMDTEPAQTG